MWNTNQIAISGNLIRDPEEKTTSNGKRLCRFSIANNRGEKVGFYDCTAWEKTAEIVMQYCRKGTRVLITGALDFSQWEKDGQKISKVSIDAKGVEILSSKNDGSAPQPKRDVDGLEAAGIDPNCDIPF